MHEEGRSLFADIQTYLRDKRLVLLVGLSRRSLLRASTFVPKASTIDYSTTRLCLRLPRLFSQASLQSTS